MPFIGLVVEVELESEVVGVARLRIGVKVGVGLGDGVGITVLPMIGEEGTAGLPTVCDGVGTGTLIALVDVMIWPGIVMMPPPPRQVFPMGQQPSPSQ